MTVVWRWESNLKKQWALLSEQINWWEGALGFWVITWAKTFRMFQITCSALNHPLVVLTTPRPFYRLGNQGLARWKDGLVSWEVVEWRLRPHSQRLLTGALHRHIRVTVTSWRSEELAFQKGREESGHIWEDDRWHGTKAQRRKDHEKWQGRLSGLEALSSLHPTAHHIQLPALSPPWLWVHCGQRHITFQVYVPYT